jgi:hypothetical protein
MPIRVAQNWHAEHHGPQNGRDAGTTFLSPIGLGRPTNKIDLAIHGQTVVGWAGS